MATQSLKSQLAESQKLNKKIQKENEELKNELSELKAKAEAFERLKHEKEHLRMAHEDLKSRVEELSKPMNFEEATEHTLQLISIFNAEERMIIANNVMGFVTKSINKEEQQRQDELRRISYTKERLERFQRDLLEGKLG